MHLASGFLVAHERVFLYYKRPLTLMRRAHTQLCGIIDNSIIGSIFPSYQKFFDDASVAK